MKDKATRKTTKCKTKKYKSFFEKKAKLKKHLLWTQGTNPIQFFFLTNNQRKLS